jgi:hypothetical protein
VIDYCLSTCDHPGICLEEFRVTLFFQGVLYGRQRVKR